MTAHVALMEPARDLDGVLEIEQLSFTNPWTREMYERELEHSRVSRVYVLRENGRILGFCSLWLILDELHINNLAIHPEGRGRGLGSVLLKRVLEEGAREGAKRATLEVRRSNEPARRLYRRMGFEMVGTRRNYYTSPVEDALILWHEGLIAPPHSSPSA